MIRQQYLEEVTISQQIRCYQIVSIMVNTTHYLTLTQPSQQVWELTFLGYGYSNGISNKQINYYVDEASTVAYANVGAQTSIIATCFIGLKHRQKTLMTQNQSLNMTQEAARVQNLDG